MAITGSDINTNNKVIHSFIKYLLNTYFVPERYFLSGTLLGAQRGTGAGFMR